VPAPSQPPPSTNIPGKQGSPAPYVIGIVLLVAGAIGLFCWKSKQPPPTVTTTQSAGVTASVSAPPPPPQMQFAPPPPPPIDEPDAGSDAGAKPVAKGPAGAGTGTGGPVAPGPCGKCEGQSNGALNSALTGKARSAQGCYNRALRTSEVSGSMTVSVQVSATGAVCGASLANDSVHSSEVASCVLGRFRGQSFPPPTGGCVTVNIPISFTIKQ
jgi:TonB family protein